MACSSSLQPRLVSSFFGDRLLFHSSKSLIGIGCSRRGTKHTSLELSRTMCNLADILFNRRSKDEFVDKNRKRLRPGKVSPRLLVPHHIQRPPYVNSRHSPGIASGPEIHDEKGIESMRASGRLAAQVLQYAGTLVQPGKTTDEIDKAVHQMIIDNGAYPSPLGYGGFPKSVCTSINEVICHGIPDSRPLEDGDIVNIDVTVYLNTMYSVTMEKLRYEAAGMMNAEHGTLWCTKAQTSVDAENLTGIKNLISVHKHENVKIKDKNNSWSLSNGNWTYRKGYHGDTSATFLCGNVDEDAKKLIQVTEECLDKAISICAPGVELNRIGKTIHDHADKFAYGVVRQFVGHGVGRVFHADPVVLHFRNNDRGRILLGQTFTIEPMLTMGSTNPVIWSDDWTAVTDDGSLSAQFEHTILITENGAEILTQC